MSFETVTIVFLAIVLLALLFYPGELKWGRRPWWVTGPPRRSWATAFFAFILAAAVIRALGN